METTVQLRVAEFHSQARSPSYIRDKATAQESGVWIELQLFVSESPTIRTVIKTTVTFQEVIIETQPLTFAHSSPKITEPYLLLFLKFERIALNIDAWQNASGIAAAMTSFKTKPWR